MDWKKNIRILKPDNRTESPPEKSHWEWIKRLLIFGILFIFVSTIVSVIVMTLFKIHPEEVTRKSFGINTLMLQATASLFMILYTFLHVRYIDRIKNFNNYDFSLKEEFKKTGLGFLFGVILFTLYLIFFLIFIEFKFVVNPNPAPVVIIQLIVTLFIMAFFEEVIYRYYILGIVRRYSNPILALGISSLIFGIAHIFNPNVGVIGIINICGFGVFIGIVYMYYKSLCAVTILHFIWNALCIFSGFNVSGVYIKGLPFIMEYSEKIKWLSGGNFGPEGSVVTTFLLVVFSILFLKKNKDRGE